MRDNRVGMNVRTAFVATLVLIPPQTPAVPVTLDLTGVRPGPISVIRSDDSVTVAWHDETARVWRATFSLDPAQPLVTSIGSDGEAVVRSARPLYQGETGKRRGGWYAFFDDPTTHPDGTRHVQLGRLPTFHQWGDALAPLAKWEVFTTTGEVLLPDVNLTSSFANEIVATVRVLWTFPLRFAEIVWGDGQTTQREVIELTDTREFGGKTFEWRAKANAWKWARVAVWDVAGNGAFVNPFWRP